MATAAIEPEEWPMSDEWPLFSHLGPLGALPTVPRVGRRYVGVVLSQWGLSVLSDTAELIVSELATNAVGASSSPDGRPLYEGGRLAVIHLRLLSDRVRLLIEVWDSVPEVHGAPVARRAGEYDESGRGLTIVDSASERWGWRRVPGWRGKVTWALLRELRRVSQRATPPASARTSRIPSASTARSGSRRCRSPTCTRCRASSASPRTHSRAARSRTPGCCHPRSTRCLNPRR